MTVNYAVEMITNELQFQSRTAIVTKYNAEDSDISDDGFVYTLDGEVQYKHPYSAITPDIIFSSLYKEMLYLCVQTVPLSLLETKGGVANIIRNVNSDWDIRTPNTPVAGDDLDIDEILAQIAVYRALSYFGVSSYSQNAKELLNSYKENLVIPSAEDVAVSLAFRFSSDGTVWHDTYQTGDIYFSIGKEGVWGNNIPLAGTGGVTKFLQLSDVPTAYTAGKIVKVNASGTGLIFADATSEGATTFLALTDTPNTYTAGKYLAINSAGTAIEFKDAPSGSNDELVGYTPTMPYDFGSDTTKQFLELTANTTFSVALDGTTPKMTQYAVYHMQVYLNGFTFGFGASQIKTPSDMPTITGLEYAIIFNIMWDGDDIFVFNVNSYV